MFRNLSFREKAILKCVTLSDDSMDEFSLNHVESVTLLTSFIITSTLWYFVIHTSAKQLLLFGFFFFIIISVKLEFPFKYNRNVGDTKTNENDTARVR